MSPETSFERRAIREQAASWPAMKTGGTGLRAELLRLDLLLNAHLSRLRMRGRSTLGDPLRGAVIEEGESEGLLRELAEEHGRPDGDAPSPANGDGASTLPAGRGLPGLDHAAAVFGLSRLERDLLLFALAVEIDDRYARLVAFLNDHAAMTRPTVGLGLSVFSAGTDGLRAFLPEAPLLWNALLSIDGDGPLAGRALLLDEGLWARLLAADPQGAAGAAAFVPAGGEPGPSALEALALSDGVRDQARGLAAWAADGARRLLIVRGPDASGRTALATALALAGGRRALLVDAERLDQVGAAVCRREARWFGAALVIAAPAAAPSPAARDVLATVEEPIFWVATDAALETLSVDGRRAVAELALPPPDAAQEGAVLARLLDSRRPATTATRAELLALGGQFRFGPGRWSTALRLAGERAGALRGGAPFSLDELRAVCRALPEVHLGGLAARLPSAFTLEDVVLPARTRAELHLALAWARHGRRVLGDWGIGRRIFAGRGLTCLFYGPPGTGKTMAAQALANDLGQDIYRIDLSQVVNKFIGETEKNLARVFDAAQSGNAILFFDEADAIFGKRTEVRDAHDRYANVETGFLLQRLEMHEGITILASNFRQNLDDAFLRRIGVVAEFPQPGPGERRQIWQRLLPAPPNLDAAVDADFLARAFALSGGEIRNVVLAASFVAAEADRAVAMPHLCVAVYRELQKSGRLVDPAAFGAYSGAVTAWLAGNG